MKKTLLLFIFLSALHCAKASDTLTIRQVFNFEVGDTFDYMQSQFNQCVGFSAYSSLRKVVIQKSYNANHDTIYYQYEVTQGNNWYPFSGNRFFNATAFDTITHLDSFVSYLTAPLLWPGSYQCSLENYDTTVYFGHTSDSIGIGCFESRDIFRYTERLGMTYYDLMGGGDPCGTNGNKYELIHFANDSMRFDIPNGIAYLSKTSNTELYPNPTIDRLHLTFPDANRYAAHLIITDLLGQTVYSSSISDTKTTHDISKLRSGIYTWRIVSDNAILKTGKVVKQQR